MTDAHSSLVGIQNSTVPLEGNSAIFNNNIRSTHLLLGPAISLLGIYSQDTPLRI